MRSAVWLKFLGIMADDGEEDSDPEVFEITDFTTASEWERLWKNMAQLEQIQKHENAGKFNSERFIARLEEIIHNWKVDNSQQKETFTERLQRFSGTVSGKLSPKSKKRTIAPVPKKRIPSDKEDELSLKAEKLNFADFQFSLTHHCLKQTGDVTTPEGVSPEGIPQALIHMCDMEFDFPARAHCLCRWHGLREFMILSPSNSNEAIATESRMKLLWSSVGIALSNTSCHLPVFIQVQQRWRRLYYGTCIGGGFRTNFEMAHLRTTPPQCNHIAGLLDIFKAKLGRPLREIPTVKIAVRFTYVIKNDFDEDWPQELPDVTSEFGSETGYSNLSGLPFGPFQEPVSELHLAATWPCLTEEIVVDDTEYTDLDPLQAPKWSLRAIVAEKCATLLFEHLRGFIQLCRSSESTAQIIRSLSRDNDLNSDHVDVSPVLDRLTEPVPLLSQSLTSVVNRAASRVVKTRLEESPLPEELLTKILHHLFPDASLDGTDAENKQSELAEEQKRAERENKSNRDKFRTMKTAPKDSLTYLLAVCLCIVHYGYGGVKAVAHLWHEFVLEMRYRFENNIIIPRLALGPPNLNHCLIHQKLQMLNYCIQRKKRFHEQSKRVSSTSSFSSTPTSMPSNIELNVDSEIKDEDRKDASPSGWDIDEDMEMDTKKQSRNNESDSDDEFFEAVEEQNNETKTLQNDDGRNSASTEGSGWATPSGSILDKTEAYKDQTNMREAVAKETDMKLLETGETLCIPITQEPPPMTEDMLEEHAEILTQLGTSEEGARVRAQMQSASLYSDIQAFKAANPNCILADFIRWYSPTDWIVGPETDKEKEELRKMKLEMEKQTSPGKAMEIPSESNTGARESGWDVDADDQLTDEELEKALEADEEQLSQKEEADQLKWADEGHLSLRMRIPGNIWQEVWQTAKPSPVRRQKRLFDDTKEAEKVLHFLSNLRPAEVAVHLFPVTIHAAVSRISEEEESSRPRMMNLLEQIIRNTSRLLSPTLEDMKMMEEIIKQVHIAELAISRIQSLQSKFTNMSTSDSKTTVTSEEIESFVSSVLTKPEVTIDGGSRGPFGKMFTKLLVDQQASQDKDQTRTAQTSSHQVTHQDKATEPKLHLPRPTGREYVLRSSVCRPSSSSRASPQRMFAVITPDEFRLAGAFTTDTNFL